jgi:hypothetical protein
LSNPTIRLLTRNTGAPDSALQISVVYRHADGPWQTVAIGQVTGGPQWAPTPPLLVTVNLLALLDDQQAAFRFAPVDDRGDWSIDDIYIDPYSKG